ncbi:hypothetical protein FOA52_010058 [Chlamydomonas sp. UWO 241]|nr:hypothetical protein FOA52_010058 [Chlamydomonas sp. UWO 241]
MARPSPIWSISVTCGGPPWCPIRHVAAPACMCDGASGDASGALTLMRDASVKGCQQRGVLLRAPSHLHAGSLVPNQQQEDRAGRYGVVALVLG